MEISRRNIEVLRSNLFKKIEGEKTPIYKEIEKRVHESTDKTNVESTPEMKNTEIYRYHYEEMIKSYPDESYVHED